jgi:hypothetical protein
MSAAAENASGGLSMSGARSGDALLPLRPIYEKLEVHSQAEAVANF